MSRAVLKLLVDSSTLQVAAAGPLLVFSHGNVVLAPHALVELLESGIAFYRLLDKGKA